VGIDEYQYSLFTDVRFTNPVESVLNLSVSAAENSKANFTIYDITGKLINFQTVDLTTGTNYKEVDVSSLKNGLYIIRLTDRNGVSISKKMIKL
jgi:hypothetical protein